MTRQRVLRSEPPLRLSVVLDEGVLLRQVGGPQVMREQLEHLADAATWPNVELRVLRKKTGAHPAITGEFTILGFPELISPDVVYLEHMTSNIYMAPTVPLSCFGLLALALDPEQSRQMIARVAEAL